MKKSISVILALLLLLTALCVPVGAQSVADFDSSKAIAYAAANWNVNPYEFCAAFVSACLNAGGLTSSSSSTTSLFNQMLKSGEGTKYELISRDGRNIYAADNAGKFDVGDPVFFYCPKCGFEHVVLISGVDSAGRITDFAHNNPHDGTKTTWVGKCIECAKETYKVFVMHQTAVPKKAAAVLGLSHNNASPDNSITLCAFSNAIGTAFSLKIFNSNGTAVAVGTPAPTYNFSPNAAGNYTAVLTAVNKYGTAQSEATPFQVGIHLLTFDTNGGTGAPDAATKTDGKALTLPLTIPTRKNFDFLGWALTNNATGALYLPGGIYDGEGDKTLYAVWAETPLNAPVLQNISNTADGIVLQWSVSKTAESYMIFRKNDKGGWSKIGTTGSETSTSFKDKNVTSGKSYTYTVYSCRGGKHSNFDHVGLTLTYLSTPSLISVTNTTGGASIVWSAVPGAQSYVIYAKTAKSWQQIGTANGKAVTFINANAKSGAATVYTVRAVCGNSRSAYNVSGITNFFLASPKPKSTSVASNGLVFKWSGVSGAQSYTIYRRIGKCGWSVIGTTLADDTAFKDKTAKKGVTYYYTVRANGVSGRSSYYSGLKACR